MKGMRILFTVVFFCVLVNAQGVNCDRVLVQNVTSENSNYVSHFAYLKIITQSNFEENRNTLNLIVPDIASGSYDDFNSKRNELLNKVQYTASVEASKSFLQLTLSPQQIQAWSDCVFANLGGLRIFSKRIDDLGIFDTQFRSTEATGKKHKFKAKFVNGIVASITPNEKGGLTIKKTKGQPNEVRFKLANGGNKIIAVQRVDPKKSITFIAEGAGLSRQAEVAPIPPPPPDSDNDGIPDYRDLCPNRPGRLANNGCPDIAIINNKIVGGTSGALWDGNLATNWNCSRVPPCSFEIQLNSPSKISSVELAPCFIPGEYTTEEGEIIGTKDNGTSVLIANINTPIQNGVYYSVNSNYGGDDIKKIQVNITCIRNPNRNIFGWTCKCACSWVSFYEVRIIGY
jgi:hypothetical protein